VGRVIGLDLGEVRIGVAVSDPEGRMAVPAGTILVKGPPADLKSVAALVREHEAEAVVVGHPRSLSGKREAAAQHAEGFAEGLRMILDVPIHLQDERLSTVEAERDLRAAGVGGRDRRRLVDQAAATVILQSWLDGPR